MALSQVQVTNMALAKVGAEYISSMTEGAKEATYANIFWESCRDTLLESYPWNFATERASLARLAGSPVWQYDCKYQLPNDCLRVRDISVDGDFESTKTVDYRIEGRTLVTNETTVYIKYTKKVTDTSYWPPTFVRLFVCDLAALLSEPLAAMSTDQKQLILQEREMCLNEAKERDFEEGYDRTVGYYEALNCRDN